MEHLKPVDFKAVAAKGCYVYCYLREHDRTPYYVGFASNATRPRERHACQLPAHDSLIVVLRSGLSEQDAFKWERYYIKRFGRKDIGNGLLLNRTDGGQGCLGRVTTNDTKQAIKETLSKPLAEKFGFSLEEWLALSKVKKDHMHSLAANAAQFGYSLVDWIALSKGEKISIVKSTVEFKRSQKANVEKNNEAQQRKAAKRWGLPYEVYVKLDGNQSRAMKQHVRRGKGTAMEYVNAQGWAA